MSPSARAFDSTDPDFGTKAKLFVSVVAMLVDSTDPDFGTKAKPSDKRPPVNVYSTDPDFGTKAKLAQFYIALFQNSTDPDFGTKAKPADRPSRVATYSTDPDFGTKAKFEKQPAVVSRILKLHVPALLIQHRKNTVRLARGNPLMHLR